MNSDISKYLSNCIDRADHLYKSDRMDDGIDLIFDALDDAMHASKFAEVNDAIKGIKFDHVHPELLVSLLCATLPAKPKLYHRELLFKQAKIRNADHMVQSPALLKGLE